MALTTFRIILIIIAFSAVSFVITSNLIASEHAAMAKPKKKDIDKVIKKIREKISDRDDDNTEEENDSVKNDEDKVEFYVNHNNN
jgi:uncharacterized membrane protein